MKFTITRSTFLKTLNDVSRAISTKTTIPILTGLKISKSEALVKSSCQPVSLAKSLNVCQKAQ